MTDQSNKKRLEDVEELTLLELARSVNVPETTARRWTRRFAVYLGARKDRRGWHFPKEAVAILAKIMDRVRQGWTEEAVESELRGTVPVTLEMMTTATPLPVAELTATLARIADTLEKLNRQGEILQRIEALEKAKAVPWWARFWGKKRTPTP